jgi:hypothetical protein
MAILMIVVTSLALTVMGIAKCDTTSGQVAVLQGGTLFVRDTSDTPYSFQDSFTTVIISSAVRVVKQNVLAQPYWNMMQALEPGEDVTVNWALDSTGNVRQISGLTVTSAMTGITKGLAIGLPRPQQGNGAQSMAQNPPPPGGGTPPLPGGGKTTPQAPPPVLVLAPMDEPGSVTYTVPLVTDSSGNQVPDPTIMSEIQAQKPCSKVTVNWTWDTVDSNGFKFVTGITAGW